jgi:Domain of unknown function (DUF4136)
MKMQARWALLSVAVLIAVAAWASTTTDYDHNVDFANFKTYSWGKLETSNSIWDERVKSAVDSALTAKGWTHLPSGGDVLVNAFGKSHSEHTINTFYDGFEGGWRWRGFGDFGEATTTVDTYKVGTLVVDMFDSNTKNLIWRGVAIDTLSSNPEKNTKKLDGEVHKMFERFPPNSNR